MVCFSILINGCSSGFFPSSHGLRQGDPLSPLISFIVMEALCRMMDWVVGGGLLLNFSVSNAADQQLSASHLLFADDTLIFCAADSS